MLRKLVPGAFDLNRFVTPAFTAVLLAGCASTPAPEGPSAALAPVFTGAPLPATVPSDLPRIARPLHYRIEVVPDAANLVFSGTTSIDLEVYERTDALTLHANELAFTMVRLMRADGLSAPIPLEAEVNADDQTVRLELGEQAAYGLAGALVGVVEREQPGRLGLDLAGVGQVDAVGAGLDRLGGLEAHGLVLRVDVGL